MDRWDGKTFCRGLVLNGTPVEIAATQMGSAAAPKLHVTVTGVPFGPDVRSGVTDALNRMLGLQADLKGFYRYAANDARLSILARRFVDLSRPGFLRCSKLWSTALLVNNSVSPPAFKYSIASPRNSAYPS